MSTANGRYVTFVDYIDEHLAEDETESQTVTRLMNDRERRLNYQDACRRARAIRARLRAQPKKEI